MSDAESVSEAEPAVRRVETQAYEPAVRRIDSDEIDEPVDDGDDDSDTQEYEPAIVHVEDLYEQAIVRVEPATRYVDFWRDDLRLGPLDAIPSNSDSTRRRSRFATTATTTSNSSFRWASRAPRSSTPWSRSER